jgi:REP element-mobilizing transposase RayT
MEEYFKNKYRVNTIRLQDWDYSWAGFYYITICTKDRINNLAEIQDGQVSLSEIGRIVFKCWLEIPEHFDNVKLDDCIIMPNHLHGIIVILEQKDNDFGLKNRRDTTCHVSTGGKFGYMRTKSLSSIIHAFKSSVKRCCNQNDLAFQWQSRFYEHIIRNHEDYARIKKYIANNPTNWEIDRNNPINIKK